ncbi:flagellar hook-basal body complex protein FliE [Plastorhodobacter daqingensis]|uniref:Flagellar hook-basal body complex protein FliE n=1 Tax=Plastorhodobacter daqingensis TaxID=1387281 RepID=A0ABW2UEM7_9RHOB
MDMKAILAAQSYAQARPATLPGESSGGLSEKFAQVAASFTETLQQGEQTAKAAMVGDADPHALVQALAATELAVETAVTIRDKVVEAYQEILRMPV